MGLLDAKGMPVKFAAPGENVQIKINVADEEAVKRGDVLCHRDKMMPVTDIFEAEVEILELLEYKPILSKGYNCIMHIHTYNDEITIKDIIKSEEIDEKGEVVVKQKPQFTRSHTKIICRIVPRFPIALEKFETIQ
jgi:peptide chain release factor subunit 3